MLRFCGNPIIDNGVAVILSFVGKKEPEEINVDELDNFVEFLLDEYKKEYYRSFLTVLFTNNCVYLNPTMKEERKQEIINDLLNGYKRMDVEKKETCIFCGQPSYFRAFRQHFPLLTGEGILNFFPSNRQGVEICPYCLLAAQAFPFGALKVEGRCFFVFSENKNLMKMFVGKFIDTNNLNSLMEEINKKGASGGKYPKTIFIDKFLEIETELVKADNYNNSVTIYHFTNYGTNADIHIYHLTTETIRFAQTMKSSPDFKQTWYQMTKDGWLLSQKELKDGEEPKAYYHSNQLFEDIFDLPQNFQLFIRRHLLGGKRGISKRLIEQRENNITISDLHYFNISNYLLTEVLGVDKEKVEKVKVLGDKLAKYIFEFKRTSFFQKLYFTKPSSRYLEYEALRNAFLRENLNVAKSDIKELPVTFDEFVEIFTDWEDAYNANWKLGRDLVLLRIIENLYNWGYFKTDELKKVVNDISESLSDEDEQIN